MEEKLRETRQPQPWGRRISGPSLGVEAGQIRDGISDQSLMETPGCVRMGNVGTAESLTEAGTYHGYV